MSWVDEAIAAFGQSLGMDGLALDQDLRLDLALESGEVLRILWLPQTEVLVACAKPLGLHPGAALRRALQLMDYRQPSPWPLQAALEADSLVFQLRIPERAFTVSELDGAVAQLVQLQHTVLQGQHGEPADLPSFPLSWR